jgi:hypothetical protein
VFIGAKQSYEEKVPAPPSERGDHASEPSSDEPPYTLLSRLNNKSSGRIIIVMQRLHQDDLVGHVLARDYWTVLSFPAIAEKPERVPFQTPVRTLFIQSLRTGLPQAMRRRIGLYNFSSQYQQRPIPVSGNLLKPSTTTSTFCWIGSPTLSSSSSQPLPASPGRALPSEHR